MSLISLPNGNFVCGTDNSVILLNEKLQNIKEFSTWGSYSFCALSHRNEIYVSSYRDNSILVFDLNLNLLKKFNLTENGLGYDQRCYPEGLCCHEDYLYICDAKNKRIQILTLDLEYVNTITIYRQLFPNRIQISKTTIGVSCKDATLFFDLKSRTLKYTYNYATKLNYIDSIFYGSCYHESKF